MTYEEWQFEFSKSTGIPYHYLKEVGDSWCNLLKNDELLQAIKDPLKDIVDTKKQVKTCVQLLKIRD